MTLNQALAVINSQKDSAATEAYYLACGFEPLHLLTLLRAQLMNRLPGKNIELGHGVYGDLFGNIESAAGSSSTAAAVVLEWSDIDPRLGLRSSGGWSNETKADLLTGCARSYARLETALGALAARMPVALSPPHLPLPPIGNTIRAQGSVLELELDAQLASFLAQVSRLPGIRVLGSQRTEPTVPRVDARMELIAGFPYPIPFASSLAASLVSVLCPPTPKKGLITDLDDTLWSGIVGDAGVSGVSWSQEYHTQPHGLYQQMLGHLAGCGVLLAVCSKNEPATAEAALARKDFFLDTGLFFPLSVGWGPKSSGVGTILQTWNIAADAVVMIDDSPMELEEVARAHPGITCLRFAGKDPAAVWDLLGQLRDLFGKPVLTEEDKLRQSSIRTSSQIREKATTGDTREFLRSLLGSVTFAWRSNPADQRPLDLINKTNQFNLNGLRIGEREWRDLAERQDTVLTVISYRDRFGPLGKIAVLVGTRLGSRVRVSHWVMSCRAFSRKLEHRTLEAVFKHTSAEELEFAVQPTGRNQPLLEFFRHLGIYPQSDGAWRISRAVFLERCGELPHEASDLTE